MEKEITVTLTEIKVRTLIDCTYIQMLQLDKLYEVNKLPETKRSADELEEIREDLRGKMYDIEKEITILLLEHKARTLIDSIDTHIVQLKELYKKNKISRTKLSAAELGEIRNQITDKLKKD
jgi:hypothetical protein